MNISIGGMIMGFVLLIIPLYIYFKYSIDWMRQALTAFARMVLMLLTTAVFLFYVTRWDSLFVDILWLVLISALSSLVACHRARLSTERMFLPVMAGVTVAAVVVGAWTIIAIAGASGLTDTRMIIPVGGLLVGMMVESNAAALSEYYGGLRHHGELYQLLMGNGARRDEALNYFVRRAMQTGSAEGIRRMATVIISTTPVVMYTMIMCGTDAFSAVIVEMIIIIASLAAVMLSLVITLYIARRYMLDDYSRLKNDIRNDNLEEDEIR
ncbi:MAG: ABC transporter permease [Prevotella sp.]|nr:ABC transporter permease [Prevotella sp.]